MKAVRAEHHSSRRYEVRHVTTYAYPEDVTSSYGRACLRPRDTPEQQVLEHTMQVDPVPDAFVEHVDLFGNYSHYLEIHTPHRTLRVAKQSILWVHRPAPDLGALDAWTVAAAAAVPDREAPLERAAYLLPSTLVDLAPEVRAYAERYLPPDAGLGAGLAALTTGIFTDFRYAKGATTVRTTLPQLLQIGAGVCQDFAHLAIGALRSVGIPARYVSGYLETSPPPGKPKLQGSDATHAWVSVRTPDGSWLDLDPTNDCVADSRYLITAWGRDYRDVSPLKGVIFTEGSGSSLDVSVDVTRLPD